MECSVTHQNLVRFPTYGQQLTNMGAPLRFSLRVCSARNGVFADWRNGRSGPISWHPNSAHPI